MPISPYLKIWGMIKDLCFAHWKLLFEESNVEWICVRNISMWFLTNLYRCDHSCRRRCLHDDVFMQKAKMERFSSVLPIRLQEYDENTLENRDFLKRRIKRRLGKWSRENARVNSKNEYLVNTEAIGSWLSCVTNFLFRLIAFLVCSLEAFLSLFLHVQSLLVVLFCNRCPHVLTISPACNDFYNPNNVHILQWIIVKGASSICKQMKKYPYSN